MVLDAVGKQRKLIDSIRNRKKNCIGHTLRSTGLARDVIKGKMERNS